MHFVAGSQIYCIYSLDFSFILVAFVDGWLIQNCIGIHEACAVKTSKGEYVLQVFGRGGSLWKSTSTV